MNILPQTLIIAEKDIMNIIAKYEDHGYELKSMKPLQHDVHVYVMQFFIRNNNWTETKK